MSNLHSTQITIPADTWMRWHELAGSLSDDFVPLTLELRDARRYPSRTKLLQVAKVAKCAATHTPAIAERNAAKQLLAELEAVVES